MATHEEYDYIIVGGGLTGCALASRLSQHSPAPSILLLEAGPTPPSDPSTTTCMGGFALAFSPLDYAYQTAPQPHTASRSHYCPAGKTLGGGSVLNYGGWSRGDAADYDAWAAAIGDERWNYASLLPFFRRTETFHAPPTATIDPQQHGSSGPIHVFPVSHDPARKYPLRDPIHAAWREVGVPDNPDANAGSLAGIAELAENWNQGIRQPSHLAYDLSGVDVHTSTPVHRILFSSSSSSTTGTAPRATGVQLASGTTIAARREVVLSAGAIRTPHLLLLSGIGPPATLTTHAIPPIHTNPHVGATLHDHFCLFQFWRLHAPLALGAATPAWAAPALYAGMPCDWTVGERVPAAVLAPAVAADVAAYPDDEARFRAVAAADRVLTETRVVYAAGASQLLGLQLPDDGTYASSYVMLTLPTSRGRVTLGSADAADAPVVDPGYFGTVTDRAVLAYGVQRVVRALLGTEAGKGVVAEEVVPAGEAAFGDGCGVEEVVERVRRVGISQAHAAGSCAMGKVVDGEGRVLGVEGLRVCDASVLPVAVGGHPMATLYMLAERVAEMMRG